MIFRRFSLRLQCRPADTQKLCSGGNIALRTGKRAQDHAALRFRHVLTRIGGHSQKIGGGQRARQCFIIKLQRKAGRTCCTDDEIVLVNRDQRPAGTVWRRRKHDARIGESLTEIFRLDAPGGIDDRHRNELCEGFRQVCPAGGYVERRHQVPAMVVDGRNSTGKPDIAGVEMLFAMDGQRALLHNAGADAIGAFALLAPDGSRPQAPAIEGLVVARSPRRSTGTPLLSASSTQQPTPPTAI